MTVPHFSDKELDSFFAPRADPFLESFFDNNLPTDFGSFPDSFESSVSSGSAETQLFDSLSTSSSTSFGLNELSPSSAFDLVLRPAYAPPHKGAPTHDAVQSRKLVHQFRPEGPGISGSELLSLEGQSQPPSSGDHRHHPREHLGSSSCGPLPSTPPITPNLPCVRRRTSTSPIRKSLNGSQRRSKSHSSRLAAALASSDSSIPDVPPIPHALVRMHSQTMLRPAERDIAALGVRPQTLRLPPSPPASSRFPPYDYYPAAMRNHDASVASVFHPHDMDGATARYCGFEAPAFSSPTSEEMPALSAPWPASSQHSPEDGYAMGQQSWETLHTPILDHPNSGNSLYDMPSFSATEDPASAHAYLFDASLATSGLMIQHHSNIEHHDPRYGSIVPPPTRFDYASARYDSNPPSPGAAPSSISPSIPLHPANRSAEDESEPPPITLPKRGSNANANARNGRRNATKHNHGSEQARGTGSGKGTSGNGNGTLRRTHTATHSTGSIRSPSTVGSVRARKSTGSLVAAANKAGSAGGAGGSGGRTAGAKSTGNGNGRNGGAGGRGADKAAAVFDGDAPSMPGFVNYTPSDSRKILTGVAPSGSSKTKARREREAVERRRRLSEAAARAVRAAGGDVQGFDDAMGAWDSGNSQ